MNKIALRIIWTSHDHYSDLTSTYNLKNKEIGNYDLRIANAHEWNIRELLKDEELHKMRVHWEKWKQSEVERLETEELKLKEKSKNKKESKPRKIKANPEPICPDEYTAVDIEDKFIEYNNELIQKESIKYSPDVYQLGLNEVNMRCYRIMGGIFHINAIIQLEQSQEFDRKIFQNLNSKQTLTFNDTLSSSRDEDNLIQIKLKLSDNIIWWTTPIVCKWIELSDKNIESKNYNDINMAGGALFSSPEIKPDYTTIDTVEDFDLLQPPDDMNKKIISFLQRHVVPRLPDMYKFDMELDEEKEILRKKLLKLKEIEMEKMEELARRQLELDAKVVEMRQIEADLLEKRVEQLKNDQLNARKEAARKLTNSGETENNVVKFLKKRETEDEEYLNRMKNEGMDKINEMIITEEHKQIKEDSLDITKPNIKHDVEHIATPPRELYPKRKKLFPLRIINKDSGEIFEFDLPKLKDNLELNVNRPDQGPIYASKFLKFLQSLNKLEETKLLEKNKQNKKSKKDQIKNRKSSVLEIQENNVHGYWSTENIEIKDFQNSLNEIVFESKYFGIFGFALPRYCLYPITHWEIKPELETKEQIVSIAIETKHISLKIIVTVQGYSALITHPKEMINRFENIEPQNYKFFENWLTKQGIDLFPKIDAHFYIPSANIKHLAMEKHTYNCLAQFALTYKFWRTPYNQYAGNRTALMYSMEIIENYDKSVAREVIITPELCKFVHTTEKCTSPTRVELNNQGLPEEQDFCPDLYFLLILSCNEISKRKRDQMRMILKYNLAFILDKLKLFSFS